MSTGRALTTEYERECLRGENGEQRRYEARSRIKSRIRKRLTEDIDLFEAREPEIHGLLKEVVCDDADD